MGDGHAEREHFEDCFQDKTGGGEEVQSNYRREGFDRVPGALIDGFRVITGERDLIECLVLLSMDSGS